MSVKERDTYRPQQKSIRRPLRLAVLALLLIGLLILGIPLGRLAWATLAVKTDLDALQALAASDPQALDIQEAAALLHTTRTDVETLRTSARPFLWLTKTLGWLPRYGPTIQAAPALIDIAVELTTAAEQGLEPLLHLAGEALGQASAEQGKLLEQGLQTLHRAQPQLSEALSHVRAAEQARQELTPETLDPRLRKWMPRLDQALRLTGLGVRAGLILPELMGAESSSTLLVLVQNEDELRATGGFISGVARLTLSDGAIEDLVFEDSYALDDFSHPYPDPPQPLLDTMMTELWLVRDSNWSPDWPTSAQTAIDLYTISRDAEIDSVLAIDQRAISLLIDALGPLYLEGRSEPVTGANVIDLARQSWEQGQEDGGDWWQHRKDFMLTVVQATLGQLEEGLDRETLYRLYKAAVDALDEKHMLVYMPGEQSAELISELGWDGALRTVAGDYVMVVDTNVGFNKASALVTTELEYIVDLTDVERPRAGLTVRHQHPVAPRDTPCRHEPRYDETYNQMMERCYWDYLRVYVPAAAQLTDATPHAIPASMLLSQRPSPPQVTVGPPEQGRNVFATLLLVQPSETVETRFEYTLPPDVLQIHDEQFTYRLLIQKQSGTYATPVHVRLRLPEGTALVQSDPLPDAQTPSTLDYTLSLATDQALRVLLAKR